METVAVLLNLHPETLEVHGPFPSIRPHLHINFPATLLLSATGSGVNMGHTEGQVKRDYSRPGNNGRKTMELLIFVALTFVFGPQEMPWGSDSTPAVPDS